MELLIAVAVTMGVAAMAALIVWRVTNPESLPPQWLPPLMLGLAVAGLVGSFVIGSALNFATFSLLTLWSVFFVFDSRARRRSSR